MGRAPQTTTFVRFPNIYSKTHSVLKEEINQTTLTITTHPQIHSTYFFDHAFTQPFNTVNNLKRILKYEVNDRHINSHLLCKSSWETIYLLD